MAPSALVVNVLGAVGGILLGLCQVPQLLKLYRTKSAKDLSYLYLVVYSGGLLFIVLYLWFEDALVGFICECVELACGITLILAKYYLDHYGPLSQRAKRRLAGSSSSAEMLGGEPGSDDPRQQHQQQQQSDAAAGGLAGRGKSSGVRSSLELRLASVPPAAQLQQLHAIT